MRIRDLMEAARSRNTRGISLDQEGVLIGDFGVISDLTDAHSTLMNVLTLVKPLHGMDAKTVRRKIETAIKLIDDALEMVDREGR